MGFWASERGDVAFQQERGCLAKGIQLGARATPSRDGTTTHSRYIWSDIHERTICVVPLAHLRGRHPPPSSVGRKKKRFA